MANLIIIQVAVALIGFAIYICRLIIRRKSGLPLPPGPPGLPILGNIRELPPPGQAEYEHWLKFKDAYGPLSSITIGGQPIILIHDRQIAFDILEKASLKTSNRPSPYFAVTHCGFGVHLALLQYGPAFRYQRKLVHQVMGTKRNAEQFNDVQDVESRRFLLRILNEPREAISHIRKEAAATILQTIYGYSMQPHGEDPLVALIEREISNFSHSMTPLSWAVDILPALDYLPEGFPFTGYKKTGRQWKHINDISVDVPYKFVRKQMDEGTHRPSYVSRLVEHFRNVDARGLSKENEDAIKLTAATMYGGGAAASVASISSFLLAMLKFPEVQKKAQQEIDLVVGTDRLPEFTDQDKLPYVNALIKETYRWFPVLPIPTTHVAAEEIIYNGYRIPKGSYLLASVWWFLHDPQVHPNPDVFDPERFLEPRNEPDPESHAFGYGRRVCPGKFLAVDSLFITISRFLAVFDISKAIDANGKEIEPVIKATSGLVSQPTEFPFAIKPRSAKHAELIRAVEVLHPWSEGHARHLDSEMMKELEE